MQQRRTRVPYLQLYLLLAILGAVGRRFDGHVLGGKCHTNRSLGALLERVVGKSGHDVRFANARIAHDDDCERRQRSDCALSRVAGDCGATYRILRQTNSSEGNRAYRMRRCSLLRMMLGLLMESVGVVIDLYA